MNAALAGQVVEKLYEAEVRGAIEWLFDGGFQWEVYAGPDRRIGDADTYQECVRDMASYVANAFPESPFALWWRTVSAN